MIFICSWCGSETFIPNPELAKKQAHAEADINVPDWKDVPTDLVCDNCYSRSGYSNLCEG